MDQSDRRAQTEANNADRPRPWQELAISLAMLRPPIRTKSMKNT
jgi:hypothetical protein